MMVTWGGQDIGWDALSMMLSVVDWRGMSSLAKLMSQRSSAGSSENCLTGPDSSLDLAIGSSLGTGVATYSGVDFVVLKLVVCSRRSLRF